MPFVKNTRPFSISKGCPQSTSKQDGGQELHELEDRHSISSSPFRLKPSLHEKVARPPILNVVKTIEPLAGGSNGLHKVSLQLGASGSHFPLVSQRRRSKPVKKEEKRLSGGNLYGLAFLKRNGLLTGKN